MSHKCDALVINCMDFRLQKSLVNNLPAAANILSFDLVSQAGAVKPLLVPETRQVILDQVELSKQLHQIKKVILVNHTDCGAYGGSNAFSSFEEEIRVLTEDLKRAADLVKEHQPSLEVVNYLAVLYSKDEKNWQIEFKIV